MGYFNHYAREGLASEFMKGLTGRAVIVGTMISMGAVLLISTAQGGLASVGAAAIIVIASLYFRSRLGGVTGDCFGATFQFVEIATYAAFLT